MIGLEAASLAVGVMDGFALLAWAMHNARPRKARAVTTRPRKGSAREALRRRAAQRKLRRLRKKTARATLKALRRAKRKKA